MRVLYVLILAGILAAATWRAMSRVLDARNAAHHRVEVIAPEDLVYRPDDPELSDLEYVLEVENGVILRLTPETDSVLLTFLHLERGAGLDEGRLRPWDLVVLGKFDGRVEELLVAPWHGETEFSLAPLEQEWFQAYPDSTLEIGARREGETRKLARVRKNSPSQGPGVE